MKILLLSIAVIAGSFYFFSKVDAQRPPAGIEHTQGSLVMYSLTTCGRCNLKRKELNEARIPFTEYFIDKDNAANKRLWDKINDAGMRMNSVGTPVFEINGELIMNNPPLETLKARLK